MNHGDCRAELELRPMNFKSQATNLLFWSAHRGNIALVLAAYLRNLTWFIQDFDYTPELVVVYCHWNGGRPYKPPVRPDNTFALWCPDFGNTISVFMLVSLNLSTRISHLFFLHAVACLYLNLSASQGSNPGQSVCPSWSLYNTTFFGMHIRRMKERLSKSMLRNAWCDWGSGSSSGRQNNYLGKKWEGPTFHDFYAS